MAVNKISGLVNLPGPPVPISLAAGNVFMLPVGQGVVGSWGALTSPQIGINSTMTGQFFVELGLLTNLQVYDYQLYAWRNVQVAPGQTLFVSSDGTNFRIANTTGSPVGAVITALGSGGTDGFYGYNNQRQAITIQNGVTTTGNTLFTVSTTGGALWNAIVGGQISITINFTAAMTYYQNIPWYTAGAPSVTGSPGSGYTAAPNIVFTPPPNQGAQPYILPTATCTISGGAINAVNVVSSGAGLLGLPGIIVVPQPGDTTGAGAVLGWTSGNGTEQNAGKCVALWPLFPGTAQTSVPSFTFGGTSNPGPTATAIMNFTITSFATGTAGVGYGTTPGGVLFGGVTAGSDLTGNPSWNKNISLPIFPPINVATSTGTVTLAGNFGGVNIQAIPSYCAIPNGTAAPSTANATTPAVGGASDTFFLITV